LVLAHILEQNVATSALAKHNTRHMGVGKFWIWGSPGGTSPKMGEDTSGTHMYHHAKFHTDWCHLRRDICDQKNWWKANL